MAVLCQLEEMGLSCFGCCGNNYSNKKKLMRDIRRNTLQLDNSKSISHFMSRTRGLKQSGICANLVFKGKKFFCPGHPALRHKDYRSMDPDCDKEHICETYRSFNEWSSEKQQQFLDFVKSKRLDSCAYSIKMDNNSLLNEFEKRIK